MEFKHEETRDIRLTLYELSYVCEGIVKLRDDYKALGMPWHADMLTKLAHSLLNVSNRAYGCPIYDGCKDVEVHNE